MTREASGSWLSTAAALLCLLLSACAVEKHHRALSFFFDGVPDPNAPKPVEEPSAPLIDMASLTSEQRAAMLGRKVPPAKITVTFHKPVKDRDCQACHQGGGVTSSIFNAVPTLLMAPPELCWRCHEEPQFEFAHGPTSAGLCLICHLPHQSLHKALLSLPETELCRTCHTPGNFFTFQEHAAAGAEKCTQCHGPHGADRPSLLRPGAPDVLPEPRNAEDDDQEAPPAEPEPASEGEARSPPDSGEGAQRRPATVAPDHDP